MNGSAGYLDDLYIVNLVHSAHSRDKVASLETERKLLDHYRK
jgi:uncharacterized membrane protein YkvA (DUF1232 family)